MRYNNYNKGLERYSIAAYVQHGIRIPVPLSAPARRELQRIRSSVAGLTELSVAATMQRAPFENVTEFTARVLQVRSDVHGSVVAAEQV